MSSLLNSNIQRNLFTLPAFTNNVKGQFVVRPTGSPNLVGVSGFIFDIISTEEVFLDADITDHYIEDNTSIQDQIALRPEKFILSGYVGELTNNVQSGFLSILTTVQSFGTIPGFGPSFSNQATKTYAKFSEVASKVGNVINQAQNIFSLFSGISTTATKQQKVFQYFYNLWLTRQLCEIETPYGILKNMAIESVRSKQDENTRLMSDFAVTFKAIRFANTKVTTSTGADLSSVTERAEQVLKENPDNSGSTTGTITYNSIIGQSASLLDN